MPGDSDATDGGPEVSVIRVGYRYPGVWPQDTVTFRPCVFGKEDGCVYEK